MNKNRPAIRVILTVFPVKGVYFITTLLGVALEALGLYQPLVDFAGCGATVPLTGFGYTLARGTEKAIGEQGWLGILTGPFSAGAAGIATALISGLVVSAVTKPRSK